MPGPARLVVSCVDYPLPDGPVEIIVRAFDAQTHDEVDGYVSINGEHRADMVTNRPFRWMLRPSDEAIVCAAGFAPATCALTVSS